MFVVNRIQFIKWTERILLERDAIGHVICVESDKCEEAEKMLKDGKRVYFTINNKVVSYMEKNKDGEIREVEFEETR